MGLMVPGFIDGAGSVLDFTGSSGPQWHPTQNPWERDRAAVGSDWGRVGASLYGAIADHEERKRSG